MKEIKTQAELEAALAEDENAEVILTEGDFDITIGGKASPLLKVMGGVGLRLEAWGNSQPRLEAWGNSQPRLVARDNSQPRLEARGNSQPRLEARGNSQPRLEAWGNSQPRLEAWGYVQLSLFGRVIGTASANVSVLIDGEAKIEGGKQTIAARSTPQEWCDYYGVSVMDGVATLYKAVNGDFISAWGFEYRPGTIPVAPDWDGGEQECGKGLHFSPSPAATREFVSDPLKHVACPVALSDIAVHPGGEYPAKVKARGCCAPVYEVDEDGEPVTAPAEDADAEQSIAGGSGGGASGGAGGEAEAHAS